MAQQDLAPAHPSERAAGEPLLRVEHLRVLRASKHGFIRVVDDISFELRAGETLGLVGESGSGKSTTCLAVLRLLPSGSARVESGRVYFRGTDLLSLSEGEMRRYRGRHLAIILQDPMSSLNPVLSVGDQVGEPARLHLALRGRKLLERVVAALRRMRIADPAARVHSYPHQLSGGMRQRVCGAMALAADPQVLIADEPTTALDATIQAQYLALLKEIQERTRLAILFVTHDFGIVATLCNRVAVMYAGQIVEQASVHDLFLAPSHPYTQALLKSVPDVAVDVHRLVTIDGQPPTLYDLPPGCRFAPRCPYRRDRCSTEEPPAVNVAAGHVAACWKLIDYGG